MKSQLLIRAILALGVLTTVSARASSIDFNFSYSGSDGVNAVSASGTLITDGVLLSNSMGSYYTVTGINGTRDGVAITGLLAPNACCGTTGSTFNDNLLYVSPLGLGVDVAGIGYSVGSLGVEFYSDTNVQYHGLPDVEFSQVGTNDSTFVGLNVTSQVTPVPLPATFWFMVLGLAAFGLLQRKGRSSIPSAMPFA